MIQVIDHVLTDPEAYRAYLLGQTFQTVHVGGLDFQGIALVQNDELNAVLTAHVPGFRPALSLSFARRSPEGQVEPNYIHSDAEMGDWTAILYLNPEPAPGDGTRFWMHRPTWTIGGPFEPDAAKELARWECWREIPAAFNRLLLFRSALFHSRSLVDNYGAGADARLIHVVFGHGEFSGSEGI